jgi:hypothetical protein
MFKRLMEFKASLKEYPPIPMGTSDPYTPGTGAAIPARASGSRTRLIVTNSLGAPAAK